MSRAARTRNQQASVDRYLLPGEVPSAEVRQHPAILMPSLAVTAGGLFVALAVSSIPFGAGTRITVWVLAGLLTGRSLVTVLRWAVNYLVITSERVLLTTGTWARSVVGVPITELSQFTFYRSFFGRMVGYGTFVVESGITRLAIDCIPYPEQLFLIVCAYRFPEAGAAVLANDGYTRDVYTSDRDAYDDAGDDIYVLDGPDPSPNDDDAQKAEEAPALSDDKDSGDDKDRSDEAVSEPEDIEAD